MRILLLTTHLNIGGITTYTVSLAKALKEKGEDVIVASSGGILVPELTAGGISHIKIDINTKSELSPKVFFSIFEVRKLVKKMKIDVIHAQTRVAHVIGFFVSKTASVKFVTTCHVPPSFKNPKLCKTHDQQAKTHAYAALRVQTLPAIFIPD